MDSWTRTYLGSLLVILTFIGVVPAQDNNAENIFVEPYDVTVGADATLPSEIERMVRLTYDGNLLGRVRVLYPTGKMGPAFAEVAFIQAGKVMGATRTNGEGTFQVAGLQPGQYTATVSAETGATDFIVNVLPNDSPAINAAPIPTPTPEIVSEELTPGIVPEELILDIIPKDCFVEEFVEAMPGCCVDGGFAGGGGFGAAGGGWWPLAGMAGLAGLAGLTGNDGKKTEHASPHAP